MQKLIVLFIMSPVIAYAASEFVPNPQPVSELAARIGVSFWCHNHKTTLGDSIGGFSVRCENAKIESIAYRSYVKTENNGKLGFIRKNSIEGLFQHLTGAASATESTALNQTIEQKIYFEPKARAKQ